jgi:hypothetical protein
MEPVAFNPRASLSLGQGQLSCPFCDHSKTKFSGILSNSRLAMSLFVMKCKCGRQLSIKPESAGKKGKCPNCGSIFTIPVPAKNESPSAKDPEKIPFANDSKKHANDAFWDDSQKSTASPVAKSHSEKRSILVNASRSTIGCMQNAMKKVGDLISHEMQK